MLPIRQQLNKLGCLNRTQRAILIEVCELAENGRHGACTASNEHFMDRIITSERTTSRCLGELERLGLLHCTGSTNRRQLHPTDLTRSCYDGSAAEVLSAVAALDTVLISARQPQLVVAENGEVTTAKLSPKLPPSVVTIAKTTAIRGATTAIGGNELPPSVVATTAIPCSPYKVTSIDEQKDEHRSYLVEGLHQQVADLKTELQAAYATCSQRTDEILVLKSRIEKALEVYHADQETIIALKAELVTPKKNLPARVAKPVASLIPADYRLPYWATDQFTTSFAEWLAFRQKHRAGKLQGESIQKLLNEMEGYDEGFCCFLFDKAIKGGYQGLTFNDTPATYETYKSNQSTPFNPLNNPNGNSTQQQSAYEQRHGLVDRGKIAASLAFSLASGI